MTDDQHAEGTPESGGRWNPLPQGDYDDGATAFVKLPEGGIDALLAADSPLAAPGHGYVPPPITVAPAPPAATDPTAAGGWAVPGAPAGGTRWPEANAVPQDGDGGDAGGDDRFTYHPGATQQWNFQETQGQHDTQAGQPAAPGHDVTGQWSIPVAGGELPDESGEFTTSSLVQQWGGTPPATLPGGASAPWAAQPWSRPEQDPAGDPYGAGPAADAYRADPSVADPHAEEAAHAHGADGMNGAVGADGLDTQVAGGHGQAAGAHDTPGRHEPADGGPGHPAPAASAQAPQAEGARQAEQVRHSEQARYAERVSGAPEAAEAEFADGVGVGVPDGSTDRSVHGHDGGRPADGSDDGSDGDPVYGHDAEGAHGHDAVSGPAAPARAHTPGDAAEGPVEASEGPAEPPADPAGQGGAADAPGAAEEPATAAAAQTPPDAEPDADPGGSHGEAAHEDAAHQDAAREDAAHGDAAREHEHEHELRHDGPDPQDDPPPAPLQDEHPLASYVLRVNGADRPVTDAWIGESLLYVLRERLGLAGAKDGCSQGECGACNVQVDGRLVASCLVPAVTAAGSEVRTVEGLAADGQPSDVQRALARCGAVQCGFCVPGMAMTVHDLLEGNPEPSELETRQALCGNLCRCSGYRGVLEAVREVVAERAADTGDDAAEPDADEPRIPHQAGPGAGGIHPSAFDAPHQQDPHDPHDPYGQDGGQA
ncbi:(2Fe-2S)-binding protein [Streptomyces sp. NPDC018610]|uniref:(2Fe-2S)-binding protein n=1 Tax=Streptomyces sp. NPDC018610 TaxID=3365049 RepID=UPI0037A3A9D5